MNILTVVALVLVIELIYKHSHLMAEKHKTSEIWDKDGAVLGNAPDGLNTANSSTRSFPRLTAAVPTASLLR